ncbi:hypothetical protein C4J81_15725 [Deltaproteobacteria bacterium Smac51]|nr:hypothetical protein C4J81_15725 [Deltaproteobacteria bacterium Smac51]
MHKDPGRGGLHQQFQTGLKKRQTEMAALRQQEQRLYGILAKQWDERYKAIRRMPMFRQQRREVMKAFADKKAKELGTFRQTMKQKRDEVAKHYPYTSWSRFLRHQANRGNETALAILRSRKEKIQRDRHIQTAPSQSSAAASKATLASVAAMREVFRSEGLKDELQYTIDTKGTIIFKLSDGAFIRDSGAEVHCCANNEQAQRIALKLAQSRWDQTVSQDGNIFKNSSFTPPTRQQTPGYSGEVGR